MIIRISPPPLHAMPRASSSSLPAAWPFAEARRILARLERLGRTSCVLETGYGPSGLPHIGTFAEVARTAMVRRALAQLAPEIDARVLCFSDDMDGLRKVPENLPNQAMLKAHLGRPLSAVPDPFGTHASLGAHNNARLRAFLDRFEVAYTFLSSSEQYRAGAFDATLAKAFKAHDAIVAIVAPELGAARAATYSPFLPIHPETGKVVQAQMLARDEAAGRARWRDPDSTEEYETSIYGGACKLQWRADWAMRWAALGVDYEMAGKDLIDSVRLSSRICRALDAKPPETMIYELFLDEEGRKISKSLGNGVEVDTWLRYAPRESLEFYLFQTPKRARRLALEVLPRAVDDWLDARAAWQTQTPEERLANPVWHIHAAADDRGAAVPPVGYAMLLNLAAATGSDDPARLWGFIRAYAPNATPATDPVLAAMAEGAAAFFADTIRPTLARRPPSSEEAEALRALADGLEALPADAPAADAQTLTYDIGRTHGFAPMRAWFQTLYETLLGQAQGPRFGSFARVYGYAATARLARETANS